MTDPAYQTNATAAGVTLEQSTLLETAVREVVSMARMERDQLSAQVVQLQQQLAVQRQQQQASPVSTPSGTSLGFSRRPGDGKNWEEFAFKLVAHTATFSSNASSLTPPLHRREVRGSVTSGDDCSKRAGSTYDFPLPGIADLRGLPPTGEKAPHGPQWT
eukprot:725067-Amphidinium_carterae.2